MPNTLFSSNRQHFLVQLQWRKSNTKRKDLDFKSSSKIRNSAIVNTINNTSNHNKQLTSFSLLRYQISVERVGVSHLLPCRYKYNLKKGWLGCGRKVIKDDFLFITSCFLIWNIGMKFQIYIFCNIYIFKKNLMWWILPISDYAQ